MSRAVVIIGALFLQHCYHPRAQAASGLLCCEAGAGQYPCKARAGRCMTPATLPRGDTTSSRASFQHCRALLPAFMVAHAQTLPTRNR